MRTGTCRKFKKDVIVLVAYQGFWFQLWLSGPLNEIPYEKKLKINSESDHFRIRGFLVNLILAISIRVHDFLFQCTIQLGTNLVTTKKRPSIKLISVIHS